MIWLSPNNQIHQVPLMSNSQSFLIAKTSKNTWIFILKPYKKLLVTIRIPKKSRRLSLITMMRKSLIVTLAWETEHITKRLNYLMMELLSLKKWPNSLTSRLAIPLLYKTVRKNPSRLKLLVSQKCTWDISSLWMLATIKKPLVHLRWIMPISSVWLNLPSKMWKTWQLNSSTCQMFTALFKTTTSSCKSAPWSIP